MAISGLSLGATTVFSGRNAHGGSEHTAEIVGVVDTHFMTYLIGSRVAIISSKRFRRSAMRLNRPGRTDTGPGVGGISVSAMVPR